MTIISLAGQSGFFKAIRNSFPGIHFYTLNKSTATRAIFEELVKG